MSGVNCDFRHIEWVVRECGIPARNLEEIFKLESAFHRKILSTADAVERRSQYSELYNAIHLLQNRTLAHSVSASIYRRLVLLFRKELINRSILDVGCGRGKFLAEVAATLPHGDLVGIDTSDVELSASNTCAGITFLKRDVTSFQLGQEFDIVFSHQVLEHIAPADFSTHISSIYQALRPAGRLIVLLPNRYWGPHDITQIIDNTCTGQVTAIGSHLNESSFSEMMPLLHSEGFANIKTILPFAAFIPPLRAIRVEPALNRFIERHTAARAIVNALRMHGKPVFKNHVVLVCQKPRPA